ncbi:bidirectional sugar transporter SWEET16-like [Salvia miltiorrhiza]|uniref:bidirectional sugar transporter SWEET16-like n=1 Tax=Salvia miltiorrhiza TaxID=226208 RepID=UPI0025AD9C7F|nr:bidirectional sugar transporter SWEET16-like [Salvia miltiorrhiza]
MEIVKKKSSENYKGVPYVTTLLSTSLWTLYGAVDPDDGVLIVTVNSVGIASQAAYLLLFLFYASKERKVKYLGLVVLELLFLGIVIAATLGVFHGDLRRTFVGVLCATFTIAMYAAPLSAVRNVVRTKSVEYMPFWLCLSLVVNAAVWFSFAMLLKDYYVLVPNAVGIVFGSLQLSVYFVYNTKSDKLGVKEEDLEQPPNQLAS